LVSLSLTPRVPRRNRSALLTRYTVWAGLMAGVGLTLLYLALFRLGSDSATLVDQSANGAAILHAYVQHTFGGAGSLLLAALIFIACLVTAVGLTCACAEFFRSICRSLIDAGVYPRYLLHGGVQSGSEPPDSGLYSGADNDLSAVYRTGGAKLYPPWWHNSSRVIAPAMFISLMFGILDGIKASAFAILPAWTQRLPLAEQGLAWLMPTVVALVLAVIWDRAAGRQVHPAPINQRQQTV
jgi:LIVCS family branched-chain amino acid:cation transporter